MPVCWGLGRYAFLKIGLSGVCGVYDRECCESIFANLTTDFGRNYMAGGRFDGDVAIDFVRVCNDKRINARRQLQKMHCFFAGT